MKQYKYVIDTKTLKLSSQEEKSFEQENYEHFKFVFEQMLYQGLGSKFRDGLPKSKERIFTRILDALDKTTSEFVGLERAEGDLLNEILNSEDSKFPVQNSRLIRQYRDMLDDVEKKVSEEVKA